MTADSIALPTRLTTRSRLGITVRPATPEDAVALTGFFDGVSVEDLRFRFLSALEHVRPERYAGTERER